MANKNPTQQAVACHGLIMKYDEKTRKAKVLLKSIGEIQEIKVPKDAQIEMGQEWLMLIKNNKAKFGRVIPYEDDEDD